MIELQNMSEASTNTSPSLNGSDSSYIRRQATSQWSDGAVFLSQIFVVYVVIIAAIVNLTFFPNSKHDLWITLLSSSIGYLLPSPTIKRHKAQVIESENHPHPISN
jgi:hypothetical protein